MGKTIMIVDADQRFHDLYTAILKDSGFKITSVYDGREALSKLEKKKPDLIITDILLDMMTGDTLFLHVKCMPECEHIPVIIISNASLGPYKYLKKIDPGLALLKKTITRERFINEVTARVGLDEG